MVIKLDARFAIVWRDPFSLQLGIDPPRVVLREVSTADERMITALGRGVSRSGLEMIATSAGASEREVAALLRAVKPVLRPDEPEPAQLRIRILGAGQTVERVAALLALSGAEVTVGADMGADMGADADDPPADFGIAIGHYVLDPEVYGFWLRRDIPHLPVVFGDDSVLIGPLVEPGTSPCLYCLEFYRREADASWSAIASQLWGRHSSAETSLVAAETAARVARLVLRRLTVGRSPGRTQAARSFRIAADTGEVTRRDWIPHPGCGCVAVPVPNGGELNADPPGTGSAAGSVRPRTVEASVERA
jgi:bacteriocin biosynthesis cyclodehydratase domain-containing protein